jgi:hypothetical protein
LGVDAMQLIQKIDAQLGWSLASKVDAVCCICFVVEKLLWKLSTAKPNIRMWSHCRLLLRFLLIVIFGYSNLESLGWSWCWTKWLNLYDYHSLLWRWNRSWTGFLHRSINSKWVHSNGYLIHCSRKVDINLMKWHECNPLLLDNTHRSI